MFSGEVGTGADGIPGSISSIPDGRRPHGPTRR
jgi:hypothetical protein